MASIQELTSRINGYYDRISSNENRINKYSELYNNLKSYKDYASNHGSDFITVNNKNENTILDIDGFKEKCLSSNKYQSGTNVVLSEIACNNMYRVFDNLMDNIDAKLDEYSRIIDDCENDITHCRNRIGELEWQIEEAKRIEENKYDWSIR